MRSPLELVRNLLPRSPAKQLRLEQDILEELQFHIDCRTDANLHCGMTPDEAGETARAQFGDLERVLDACIAVHDGHPGRQAMRYAMRVLPLGLAFGLIAAVLLALYSLVVRLPASYPREGRWVVIWWEDAETGILDSDSSVNDYLAWKTGVQTAEMVALGYYHPVVSSSGDRIERLTGKFVVGDYLAQHGMQPVVGRLFTGDTLDQVARPAVISYRLWERRYHRNRSVLGTQLVADGTSYTIVGVAPEAYQTYYPFDFFAPFYPQNVGDQSARRYLASARLKPGVSIAEAQAEFERLVPAEARSNGWSVRLRRPQDVYGGTYPQQLIPCGILALVLLVLAVLSERFRAGHLRRRSLPGLLTGVAVVSLLTAFGATELLRRTVLADAAQRFDFGLDASVLVGFALLVITGVFAGEFRRQRRTPRPDEARPEKRPTISATLIASNALAFLMLVSAVLLTRDWWVHRKPNVGFKTQNVFVLPLLLPGSELGDREARRTYFQNMISGIDSLKSVSQYSFTNGFPTITESQGVSIKLPTPGSSTGAEWVRIPSRAVGLDYFETIGIEVLEGNPFRRTPTKELIGSAVVNRAFASRYWPRGSAVGQRLDLYGIKIPFEITAVVENSVSSRLGDEVNPMFFPLIWHWTNPTAVVVRTEADFEVAARQIREVLISANPPSDTGRLTPVEDAVATLSGRRMHIAVVLWASALLSLLFSASFTVRYIRRLADRGVRTITLNRPVRQPERTVLRPLLIGLGMSVVIGAMLSSPFSHLLIRIMRLDSQIGFASLAVPAILLIVMHLGIVLIPYRRLIRLFERIPSARATSISL